ncbi:phosphatase PAP2 family protein [Paraburkholderia fungorum]|uniref:phosphatase PAP2 family protein n=1 Tax=Paraburkholderia fungorum TaxID=134537 RepID=UPI0038BCB163
MGKELHAADVHCSAKLIAPHAVLLVITLLLAVVDMAWCWGGHWSVTIRGIAPVFFVVPAILAPLLFARYRHDERTRVGLVCSSLFISFSVVASIFSYLVVSTNAPLVDSSLASWDHMIGFDWPTIFLWTKERPRLDFVLDLAYSSVFAQIGVAILYLAYTRRHEQLAEFNGVLAICFLITSIISCFFPAAGPAKYYHAVVYADVSMLSHFEPLREGTLRVIDLRKMQGLVSIPSFHTIMAILLAYVMRKTPPYPVFLILNIVVIASTPTRGEHYLVDLIAGAMTVATVIALWNRHKFVFVKRERRDADVIQAEPWSKV